MRTIRPRRLAVFLAVMASFAVLATTGPASAFAAAPQTVAADWPAPLPGWFWPWARWYLGRAEFAASAPRDPATRPAGAPARVPEWAWHRLAVILGATAAEPPPAASGGPAPVTWPVPVPAWFWPWAQWQLHHGAAQRPAAAPRFVPPWAWRRLTVLRGGAPAPLPASPLTVGAHGQSVQTLQASLHAARFAVGRVDGDFGAHTRDGVMAFEKLHGLAVDGVVQPDEYRAILRSLPPDPPRAEPARYVFVDLGRQLLFDVRGGRTVNVVHISSGGGYAYTGLDGNRHLATTPRGDFRVTRKVRGWDDSYLGRLYFPSYFVGGYAIHGSPSVPSHAASHGCVRLPLWLARDFFADTPLGTPVFVR